jgi:hypothetical protein
MSLQGRHIFVPSKYDRPFYLLVSLVRPIRLVTQAWPLCWFKTRYFLTKSWYAGLTIAMPRPFFTDAVALRETTANNGHTEARADTQGQKVYESPNLQPPTKSV